MYLIFGLGNPTARYQNTRHNAGVDAICKVAAFFQVKLKKRCFRLYRHAIVPGAELVFPLTYMNNSGNIVKYFNIEDSSKLVVVCDNMDLACGGLRIRLGGGNSGQKGLASIAQALGSSDFVRIYIGIGRPEPGVDVASHVLGKETDPILLKAYNEALDNAALAIEKYIGGTSIEELQCEFNRKGIL